MNDIDLEQQKFNQLDWDPDFHSVPFAQPISSSNQTTELEKKQQDLYIKKLEKTLLLENKRKKRQRKTFAAALTRTKTDTATYSIPSSYSSDDIQIPEEQDTKPLLLRPERCLPASIEIELAANVARRPRTSLCEHCQQNCTIS